MSSSDAQTPDAETTASNGAAPSAGAGAGVGAGAGAGAGAGSAAQLRAVVTGGTGACGEHVVAELLRRPHKWSRVTTIGRRAVTVPAEYGIDQAAEEASGRLVQHVIKYDTLAEQGALFAGHTHSFCCLGTTRKAAGSAEAFRRIDFGYNNTIFTLSKAANIPHLLLVSYEGADSGSWFLYPKTKGQLEDALRGMAFPRTTVIRPGLLARGAKARTIEKFAAWIMPTATSQDVARSMVREAELDAASGEKGYKPITGNGTITGLAKRLAAATPAAAPAPSAADSNAEATGDRSASKPAASASL